jgi:hypothetical protein
MPVDFDDVSEGGYVSELVLISPNTNKIAQVVDWKVGNVTYKMV